MQDSNNSDKDKVKQEPINPTDNIKPEDIESAKNFLDEVKQEMEQNKDIKEIPATAEDIEIMAKLQFLNDIKKIFDEFKPVMDTVMKNQEIQQKKDCIIFELISRLYMRSLNIDEQSATEELQRIFAKYNFDLSKDQEINLEDIKEQIESIGLNLINKMIK